MDVEGLTGRIALLLDETAHQGVVALRLLMQARELARRTPDDAAGVRNALAVLDERLAVLEREGRERLRRARRLLRAPRIDVARREPLQRAFGTRSLRSHR